MMNGIVTQMTSSRVLPWIGGAVAHVAGLARKRTTE